MSGLPSPVPTSETACLGCGNATDHMPLCFDCWPVLEHDYDTWTFNDTHSTELRAKAFAWMRAHTESR